MAAQLALAGIGAGVSFVSGLLGGKKQKKLAKKMRREAAIQAQAAQEQFGIEQEMQRVAQARANIQARRDMIEQTREARVRRAAIIASAAASGVGLGTTGIESGAGSVVSQFGSNVGLFNIAQQASGELTRLGGLAAEQQRIQLESQGRMNVLQGQGQVAAARAQQGMAFGELLTNIGFGAHQIGNQLGLFQAKSTSSITG